jgi:hypothetical protein
LGGGLVGTTWFRLGAVLPTLSASLLALGNLVPEGSRALRHFTLTGSAFRGRLLGREAQALRGPTLLGGDAGREPRLGELSLVSGREQARD